MSTRVTAPSRPAAVTSTNVAPSPKWARAMAGGPDARVKITEGYARLVARAAYFWGWPMVNIYNRRLAFDQCPQPGLMNGVLPFAPDRAYGSPDELKALIDAAHHRRLLVYLDVVYNHFGPDGNYLGLYAPNFFRNDVATPWGTAIDFRQPPVRRFFIENALYWLMEYRFDGLRFDAVHAIADPTFLDDMAAEIRRTVERDRHVHLMVEHDGNDAAHLRHGFDAQWNDDAHHVLHVMLTGESDGYYSDYAQQPAQQLLRCLTKGFAYQGEASAYRKGKARGTPSGRLPI